MLETTSRDGKLIAYYSGPFLLRVDANDQCYGTFYCYKVEEALLALAYAKKIMDLKQRLRNEI